MKGSARKNAKFITVMAIFFFIIFFSLFAAQHANAESKVDVTLHANGGSYSLSEYGVVDSSTSVVTFNINDDGEEPTYVNTGVRPEWEGKKHVGWSTDPNAKWPTWSEWFKQPNDDGKYEFALPLDGSIKDLYAVWADEYPVTLNANGGSFGVWYDTSGSDKLETFNVVFWNTENGRSYSSTTALPDIYIDEDMGYLVHVGWSADKNAKRAEYGKGFDGLELNASTPKVLYAVFADPNVGNAVITPKQTVYNVDITKNKKCRVEYTMKWDGVASPSVSSTGWDWVDSPIGPDGKYEYNDVLFCTGGDGTGFVCTPDAYVADGWLDFDVLEKGTVQLAVLIDINGKRYSSETITVNVTDGSTPAADDPKAITPTVKLSAKNYTWNNKVHKPKVTVMDGNTVLDKSQYDLVYKGGCKAIGTYKAVVTLKDKYKGSKTVSFKIVPKGTKLSSVESGKKSVTVKWKKMTKKMPKKQITGYQIQYSLKKNFKSGNKIVKVKGAKNTSVKIKNLKKGKTYYFRIRTYIKEGSKTYLSTWSAVKKAKVK